MTHGAGNQNCIDESRCLGIRLRVLEASDCSWVRYQLTVFKPLKGTLEAAMYAGSPGSGPECSSIGICA